MSELRDTLQHSFKYFIGNVLVMMSGFISFPILTRIFSISEYGVLSLITINLTITLAFAKMGLQHACIRFYPYTDTVDKDDIKKYYTTIFLSTIFLSLFSLFIYNFFVFIFGNKIVENKYLYIFYFISFILPFRALIEVCCQIFRAEQNIRLYNIIHIFNRYGTIIFGLIIVFFYLKNLFGYILGMFIINFMLACFVAARILMKRSVSYRNYSFVTLKSYLTYGMPMVWIELSHTFLNLGDRYIIQFFSGSRSVGLYSVGYNLAMYVGELIQGAIKNAITPIYMKLWNKDGRRETEKFLGKSFELYILITMPFIVIFCVICKDLIIFLASEKYREAYIICSWIIMGIFIYGARIFLDSGFLLYQKTGVLMGLIIASSVINVILNIVMIPELGIIGAAYATFISYIIYIASLIIFIRKIFLMRINLLKIIKYSSIGLILYLILYNICIFSNLMNIILISTSGMLIYLFLIFIFDIDCREYMLKIIKYK